jgi:hypothetical protein
MKEAEPEYDRVADEITAKRRERRTWQKPETQKLGFWGKRTDPPPPVSDTAMGSDAPQPNTENAGDVDKLMEICQQLYDQHRTVVTRLTPAEAHAAITRLRTEATRAARIDELQKMDQDWGHGDGPTGSLDWEDYIEQRIAELRRECAHFDPGDAVGAGCECGALYRAGRGWYRP